MQPHILRLRISAIFGLLAVALGAIGAHGKVHDHLVANAELDHWQTAVSYHLPHAILLVILALAGDRGGALLGWAWRCVISGILLFSGSLYVMAYYLPKTWESKGSAAAVFAATPIGGVLFMAGWLLLALSTWRRE